MGYLPPLAKNRYTFELLQISFFNARVISFPTFLTSVGKKHELQDQKLKCNTHQNLNSGSFRMNGLNSSLAFCGRDGPSSAMSS